MLAITRSQRVQAMNIAELEAAEVYDMVRSTSSSHQQDCMTNSPTLRAPGICPPERSR